MTIHPASPAPPGEGSGDPGRNPRWVGLVALGVVAIFGAVLFLTPSERFAPTPTIASTVTTTPLAQERPAGDDVPLEEAVPGFTDTVTALGWSNDRVEVLRWAPSRPAPQAVMSFDRAGGARSRGVDASGRWYLEIGADFELTVGPVGNRSGPDVSSVETGGRRVWSASWHDTEPRRLALLACPGPTGGDAGTLATYAVVNGVAVISSRRAIEDPCAYPGSWLAGWGAWGTLLETRDEEGTAIQVLIGRRGTETARGKIDPIGPWFVAGGPDGTTIWTEDPRGPGAASFLLSADGRHRTAVPGLADHEWVDAARWSPDGSRIALSPFTRAADDPVIHIVDPDTGSVVTEIRRPGWRVSALEWSNDGRFLLYQRWPSVLANWAGVPRDVEIVFHDIVTDSRVAFPLPQYVADLRSATETDSPS